MTRGLWIFGYGSLVWRPAFDFAERAPGHVVGWTRRFWQHSTDHRGVPESPGRVVTLLPEPEAKCYGMAYRVEPHHEATVLDKLDVREQGGYSRHRVDVHAAAGTIGDALVYVATPDNDNYAGPAPLHEIAEQVRRCTGPSGANLDYVLRLAEALRGMGADDEHVFAVERLVRIA